MNDLTTKETSVTLTKQDEALLKHLREIRYGRLVVFIEAGHPVRSEEGIKSRKY